VAETQEYWEERLSRIRIATPLDTIDPLVNGWLPYQTLACRLWGRSAFHQSGGAFGFRDQLQDALAFLATDPGLTRAQILLHAAHQFVEGDVLHWWHPPGGRGIRTRFADDRVWLPYAAALYVQGTGDRAILEAPAPFLRARALEPGEDEAMVTPVRTRESFPLYEHCCRALDCSLAVGAHGLPLFGTGDWNDGMNRVGREGRGESVWMAFFLCAVLDGFLPHVRARRDPRAERYARHRAELARAVSAAGWDGEWFRRGFYDDGAPLGSRENDECRIDALVQAWSVISNAAPRDRAEAAMDAVERDLVSESEGIVRLLAPPFDRTSHDPGYIKGYVPGVRENGGQYTHAALWVARALAELGRGDRAARVLDMLSPISHTRDPAGVARYRAEPYVVAADVYGAAPHVGRGGWTWYTGSAAWMTRVVVESLLGVRIEGGDTLVVSPAIPRDWPGYRLELRPKGGPTRYDVRVESSGAGGLVAEVRLDGRALPCGQDAARIPLSEDGRAHHVRIRLG
jgi:cellobiose phosphorylase